MQGKVYIGPKHCMKRRKQYQCILVSGCRPMQPAWGRDADLPGRNPLLVRGRRHPLLLVQLG